MTSPEEIKTILYGGVEELQSIWQEIGLDESSIRLSISQVLTAFIIEAQCVDELLNVQGEAADSKGPFQGFDREDAQ